ncbi:MAG: SDR family NAD(P)-dependent oxidoreductase [Candidatus Binatia bacterium]|nr:SDR family NAD(P)-dependent oxidoreductase [Candidatus Binatia bacterium]
MGKLDGKKALVTGASRGIGKGIALALAEAGADVAIGYRREKDAAEAVVGAIEGLGRRGAAFAADVREYGAVEAMVNNARKVLGGLDIVVANAGVPTRFESTHEVDPGYWDRVIQIDLYGVFHTLRAALPHMREQRDGVLLPVSSVAADACGPKGAAYNAAKAGVNALAKTVSRENARRNVRCNVIAPGLIQTDISDGMQEFHGDLEKTIPLGRIGTVEEVGAMAVYLSSKDAEWITGKVFRIDGGAW